MTMSASAKKNAKRHESKRNRKCHEQIPGVTTTTTTTPPPSLLVLSGCSSPKEDKLWAEQVILKNIVWFHSTMDCPASSPYKSMLLKKHLVCGVIKGTLEKWMKESSMYTMFYIVGVLDGKFISTSYVTAEFYDGKDRWVLTKSKSLYKLGASAFERRQVKENGGCLTVDQELENTRIQFYRRLRIAEVYKFGSDQSVAFVPVPFA